MIIGLQGSQTFGTRIIYDYPIFLAAMERVLKNMKEDDTEIVFFSVGPHRINEMLYEFINVANWKSRGIKIKVVKMPQKALARKMNVIDEFVFLCRLREPTSWLCDKAEEHDIIPQISRYL